MRAGASLCKGGQCQHDQQDGGGHRRQSAAPDRPRLSENDAPGTGSQHTHDRTSDYGRQHEKIGPAPYRDGRTSNQNAGLQYGRQRGDGGTGNDFRGISQASFRRYVLETAPRRRNGRRHDRKNRRSPLSLQLFERQDGRSARHGTLCQRCRCLLHHDTGTAKHSAGSCYQSRKCP